MNEALALATVRIRTVPGFFQRAVTLLGKPVSVSVVVPLDFLSFLGIEAYALSACARSGFHASSDCFHLRIAEIIGNSGTAESAFLEVLEARSFQLVFVSNFLLPGFNVAAHFSGYGHALRLRLHSQNPSRQVRVVRCTDQFLGFTRGYPSEHHCAGDRKQERLEGAPPPKNGFVGMEFVSVRGCVGEACWD